MTILLVDDMEMVRDNWRRAFMDVSDDIREAETLPQAYAEFQRIPHPDLVLVDLVMPNTTEKDTQDHVAKMRALNPDVIVILVSGKFSTEELESLAAKLGTDGFMAKMEISTQRRLFTAIQPHLSAKPSLRETLDLMGKLAAA